MANYNGVIKRERVVKTEKELNKILKDVKYYCQFIAKIGKNAEYKSYKEYCSKHPSATSLNFTAFIEEKDTKLEITTKYGPEWLKPCTYIFDLNAQDIFAVSGRQAFAEFSKFYKLPRAADYGILSLDRWYDEEKGKYTCSAKPILGYNKEFENKILHNCFEYDINSAYFNVLLSRIPNLYNPIFDSKKLTMVKKGQIGFLTDDELTMVGEHFYANVVFDLIETPESIKKYYKKYYDIKSSTNDITEKLTSKAYLNLPIGYTQRFNPFFRAYVVHSCNKYVESLIDKDTLFWNTDAIFSRKKKNLDVGPNIGQFKEVFCKEIKYKGNTYQIDGEVPVYRGVPKNWFAEFEKENGRKYNLLKDELPPRHNQYEWDWDKLKLR